MKAKEKTEEILANWEEYWGDLEEYGIEKEKLFDDISQGLREFLEENDGLKMLERLAWKQSHNMISIKIVPVDLHAQGEVKRAKSYNLFKMINDWEIEEISFGMTLREALEKAEDTSNV